MHWMREKLQRPDFDSLYVLEELERSLTVCGRCLSFSLRVCLSICMWHKFCLSSFLRCNKRDLVKP